MGLTQRPAASQADGWRPGVEGEGEGEGSRGAASAFVQQTSEAAEVVSETVAPLLLSESLDQRIDVFVEPMENFCRLEVEHQVQTWLN